MILTHLKIALRVFSKDKTYALINVIGLSSAMAVSLLIIMYTHFEASYEKFNPQSDKIVRLTVDYMNDEVMVEQDCETYPPLGSRTVRSIPEAVDFTRAYHIDEKTLKAGNSFFRESLIYAADPAFLQMFNYPLIYGSENDIFLHPYQVVLTKSTAKKFFGESDVIGRTFEMPAIEKDFQVVGIVEDSPSNTHLKFNILISYPSMVASYSETQGNWNGNNTFTYIQLASADQYSLFVEKLDKLNKQLVSEGKLTNERIISQPIQDIHLHSSKSFEPEKNGDAASVYFLFGVAILVMLIAIVNYINLSTAKSIDRAKEVGIRKVVGSSPAQLRAQFMAECLIVTLVSGVVGLLMILLMLEPFKTLSDLPETFMVFDNMIFWVLFTSVVSVSTLVCGIFPAFILSALRPIDIMKGQFGQTSKGSNIRKSLVVFQFSITIFLLIQALTANQQLSHMKQKDLGINIERTAVIRAPHTDQLSKRYPVFKSQILTNPEFSAVSMSNTVPGLPSQQMSTTTGINPVDALEKHNYNFYIYFMDEDFIPMMEIDLIAGRNFISNGDNSKQVVVNEETIRLWGMKTPEEAVGKRISFWGGQATVLGVVKNFDQTSAKSSHLPIVMVHEPNFEELASIRMHPGNIKEQMATIRDIYTTVFPDSPFDFFFLDQKFDQQYKSDEKFGQVFNLLTGFAIIIACLGLFGLASFTVAKRNKEIGIRKVLGAGIYQIFQLLYRDLLLLILFAIIIAFPITYMLIENWLSDYAYRIDLSLWLFVIPAVAVLMLAFFTVLGQTWKVSVANPVRALRSE